MARHTQPCRVFDRKPIELKQHNGSVSDSVKCFTAGTLSSDKLQKTAWHPIDLSAKKHKLIAGIPHVLCRPCMYMSVPNVSSAAIKDVAHVIRDICDTHVEPLLLHVHFFALHKVTCVPDCMWNCPFEQRRCVWRSSRCCPEKS